MEYGGGKNIMTPEVLEVGKVGDLSADVITVYELSEGSGIPERYETLGKPIFGVTLVLYDRNTGETTRVDFDAGGSRLFYSEDDARDYIASFGAVYPEGHVEIRERAEWKDEEYQGHPNWYTWNLLLWVDNDYGMYKARNAHGRFTPQSARSFSLDLLPGGTQDMDGPDDMERVDWAWVAEQWNEDLEDIAS
jgi:hypothetical protein